MPEKHNHHSLTVNAHIYRCSVRILFVLIAHLTTHQSADAQDHTSAITRWVSPDGSDENDGLSRQTAWSTIGKARDGIRGMLSSMQSDIVVNIVAGDYIQLKPVDFSPSDSGQNNKYVIYRSVDGPGEARILGSRKHATWTRRAGSSRIWKVNVGANRTIGTIYEDGVRARLARSPNHVYYERYPQSHAPYAKSVGSYGGADQVTGLAWLECSPGQFPLTRADLNSGVSLTWWAAGGRCDWGTMSQPLLGIEQNRLIFARTRQFNPAFSGDKQGGDSDRFFVSGTLGMLDRPGEYYYCADDGWLYYWPYFGNMDSILVPTCDSPSLIRVTSPTPGLAPHHIKFEGLEVAYTNSSGKAGAIHLQSTHHVEIINCHISNVGEAGIRMTRDNHDCLVYGCWIEHCGTGGILVDNGLSRTDHPTRKAERNVFSNCKIHDLGEVAVPAIETAGIFLWNTSDCEVSHCEIFNSPRYAVSLRGHWSTQREVGHEDSGRHFSRNNRFEYLRLYDCMTDSGDGAILHAAHCNGTTRAGVPDPSGIDNVNSWNQILISGAYAHPSMRDYVPNGIFFDHRHSCIYQKLSNIRIDWVPTSDPNNFNLSGPYRGNGNPIERQTTSNLSWRQPYRDDLIKYDIIGLKADFPMPYDDRRDVIVDDHTTGYTDSGDWRESTLPGLYKGDGRHSVASQTAFATWVPALPRASYYNVFAWRAPGGANTTSCASYTIHHQGGAAAAAIVDQQRGNAEWVLLGTFFFNAGSNAAHGRVVLSAATADRLGVRADAILFQLNDRLYGGGEKGWWSFENQCLDQSGFGHDAHNFNVGYSALRALGQRSAYFNGGALNGPCYLAVPDDDDLDVGISDFAISLWFYREPSPVNNLRILSKGAGADSQAGYAIFASDREVSFALGNGVPLANGGDSRKIMTARHSGLHKWNHLVVNLSRSGEMVMYLNGKEAARKGVSDWSGQSLSSNLDLKFGQHAKTGALNWLGRIDEVAIYKRILDGDDIQGLFTGKE